MFDTKTPSAVQMVEDARLKTRLAELARHQQETAERLNDQPLTDEQIEAERFQAQSNALAEQLPLYAAARAASANFLVVPLDGSTPLVRPTDATKVAPEDGADGAKVRFEAAGGDVARFGLLWAEQDVPPTFPDDTTQLEQTIRNYGVRLVVIDNLDAVAGRKLEMNKAKDVTEMLAPLQAVAKRTGAAILAIEHTRKGGAGDPLDAVLGSRKITGVARFVAFVLRDQDNPAERLFGVRGNYAAEDDGTLRFTLGSAGDDARSIQVVWQGGANVSLADAMQATIEGSDSALDEAKRFLLEELAQGPVSSATVRRDAIERDIAIGTLKRARVALKIKPEQISTSTGRATYWQLPRLELVGVGSGSAQDQPTMVPHEPMRRPPLNRENVHHRGGSAHRLMGYHRGLILSRP